MTNLVPQCCDFYQDHREVRKSLDQHDATQPLYLDVLSNTKQRDITVDPACDLNTTTHVALRQFWPLSALHICYFLLCLSTKVLHGLVNHLSAILS